MRKNGATNNGIILKMTEKRTIGEEDRFIESVYRARRMLDYKVDKLDVMKALIDDGISKDIAYFAVVAATI